MKLSKLLNGIQYKTNLSPDTEITGLSNNTEKVEEGSVFVCIIGTRFDGHDFAQKVNEKGAAAIVVSKDLSIENQIIVENTSEAYAALCANYFDNPAQKLTMIGVTGTNGKTSVSTILRSIFENCGIKTGLIGTIENVIGNEVIPSQLTTPDSYNLYELLNKMVEAGCTHCVMEVSSHALKQKRCDGIHFKVGIFTNLTKDHLDYHKTIEDYFESKCKLFEICDTALVNIDDPYGKIIYETAKCDVYGYSADGSSDFKADNIAYLPTGLRYTVSFEDKEYPTSICIPGKFSVYNSLAAAGAAALAGVPTEKAFELLSKAEGVKGRVEVFPTNRAFTIIIDYAHTPDGLEKVLDTIRTMKPKRVVTLFGCGGDRDATKRPQMGEIASVMSDFVIVTSDNPRTENPSKIIEDILVGVNKFKATPYVVIENRREAIHYAVKNAQSGDVILLAGKGHETYQILETGKIHFDEREVLAEALNEE